VDQDRSIAAAWGRRVREARGAWRWDRLGGWRGAGLLLVALVLPFG